jgi:ABC-type multidrug transport system fused ATPase/permease subunit
LVNANGEHSFDHAMLIADPRASVKRAPSTLAPPGRPEDYPRRVPGLSLDHHPPRDPGMSDPGNSTPKDKQLAVPPAKGSKAARVRDAMPELAAIVAPRKWILVTGLLLIIVTRATSLAQPIATKVLIDNVLAKRQIELLPWLVLAVGVASLTQATTGYALTQIFSNSTQRLIAELRCKLQAHIARLPLLYHDANKSGSLAARVMNDVQGLQNLVGTGILNFIGAVLQATLALVVMARFSRVMTVVAFFAVLAVGTLLASGTKPLKAIAKERNKIYAEIMGRLTESLGGVRVIKGYHAEDREETVFQGGIQRLLVNTLKSVKLTSKLNLLSVLVWGVIYCVVLWVGAHQMFAGRLKLGEFFMFIVLLNYLVSPLMMLVGIGSQISEALAGLERVREILKERPEDADPKRTVAIGPIAGDVRFDGVNFSYIEGKPVLKDFSFEAPRGTVTALVGPSGSGKSTTIGLIAAFYGPTSGAITVDDTDLSTVQLDAYRTQIGVVLQETFLFDGTILDNVSFSRPGATRDDILAACKSARVDEFAEKLDEGYETVVGERGVKLSGGQRQRISIARAILADPRILILDEATSSLDTHSEAMIQEALSYLLEGRTTFVIAHRLSTIRKADQILVVDQGHIIERGTHDALIAAQGMYCGMYQQQHHSEQNLFLAPGEVPTEEAEAPRAAIPQQAPGGDDLAGMLSFTENLPR